MQARKCFGHVIYVICKCNYRAALVCYLIYTQEYFKIVYLSNLLPLNCHVYLSHVYVTVLSWFVAEKYNEGLKVAIIKSRVNQLGSQ